MSKCCGNSRAGLAERRLAVRKRSEIRACSSKNRVSTRCTTCSTGVSSLGCAASSRRSGIGSLMTQMSTHWRTGTWGMTWSTRCAAVCAIRLPTLI